MSQHSCFTDRHREMTFAIGLISGLPARCAHKDAVSGFLPVPMMVDRRVAVATHDIAAIADHHPHREVFISRCRAPRMQHV